ncbi:MAG: hypothetical protein EBX39_09025 [Actinobacteria bacterium]|nr:hypothetical protein [Actinomycetota bacterium]
MKRFGSTLILLLSVGLAASLIGTSCSAVSPKALSVGSWSLSDGDFTAQLAGFAEVYAQANGSDADLHGPDGTSWSTSFTSAFLNDQLSLQLARIDVAQRGIEITDADRQAAQQALEQNFATSQGRGTSYFSKLDPTYREGLIEGVAAQNALVAVLREEGTTEEALRRVYDASGDLYKGTKADHPHRCGVRRVAREDPEHPGPAQRNLQLRGSGRHLFRRHRQRRPGRRSRMQREGCVRRPLR